MTSRREFLLGAAALATSATVPPPVATAFVSDPLADMRFVGVDLDTLARAALNAGMGVFVIVEHDQPVRLQSIEFVSTCSRE